MMNLNGKVVEMIDENVIEACDQKQLLNQNKCI